MIKFGTSENPFESSDLTDELAFIRKFFSKKPNIHLIELLDYLSRSYKIEIEKNKIEELGNVYDEKVVLHNISVIYDHYKSYLVENYCVNNLNLLISTN